MASDTRDRIIESTAVLFQRHGFTGTGLKAISADSGAPFGSMYHFFPGGKEELAAATLRRSGRMYAAIGGQAFLEHPDDVATAVRAGFDDAARTLEDTDFIDACPIATVALEVASSNEPLRQVTAEIFEGWLSSLDAVFVAAGVSEARARAMSTLFLASLEGGFLLSRASKDATPMRLLGESVASSVEAELART